MKYILAAIALSCSMSAFASCDSLRTDYERLNRSYAKQRETGQEIRDAQRSIKERWAQMKEDAKGINNMPNGPQHEIAKITWKADLERLNLENRDINYKVERNNEYGAQLDARQDQLNEENNACKAARTQAAKAPKKCVAPKTGPDSDEEREMRGMVSICSTGNDD